jgi:hypothetical protein
MFRVSDPGKPDQAADGDQSRGDGDREPEAGHVEAVVRPGDCRPDDGDPEQRAMALLTPDAIPASPSPASASTVEVSGATISERPTAKMTSGGSNPVQYENPGERPRIERSEPAQMSGPTPMK